MTPEEVEQLCRKTFEDLSAEARKRQLSSSENFDKSILTYSASGLALSLTFLKDFIPITKAEWAWTLYGSWVFFVLSIILTTFSFAISYRVQEDAIEIYYKYYIEREESYLGKQSPYEKLLKWFNRISSYTFIAAIVTSAWFIGFNLRTASELQEKKNAVAVVSPATPAIVPVQPKPPNEPKVSSQSTKTERIVTNTTVRTVTTTSPP
ncbi:hypothetical protein [Herbaspirillum seropedicae]|uniref:hypothetical protein n=1 Tax=Herbaspirillum seropedicae TaxID=964 RepID=UPI000847FF64|nr:hypothetical protein [Herbaspirillum seropedicae]AON53122.1 hypothetical protein Hsc_0818 [Herbaspirillum seropedicae]